MNATSCPLSRARVGFALGIVCALALLCARPAHAQTLAQTDIPGPAGSGAFGAQVVTLDNGNFVVIDTGYDAPPALNVGAVSLYNGETLALISRLTGSQANDQVGNGGVVALTDANFVVVSTTWANGALANAGAATWVDGALGLTGTVTVANSLVGGSANDAVGLTSNTDIPGVAALPGGNYVVLSQQWGGGLGAATFVESAVSTTGVVSTTNSLVGAAAQDKVGALGIVPLGAARYVVISPFWNDARGAVTWVDASVMASGVVSSSNSLVGADPNNDVGMGGVVALGNGNYVVKSPAWDMGGPADDRGAVTWASGAVALTGVVTTSNSLVGPFAGAAAGAAGVTPLSNGDYVIATPNWGFSAGDVRGAVTWADGTLASSGIVTATNSLIGADAQHAIASAGATALTNGNYIIRSPAWDGSRGAATWVNPALAKTGVVSTTNSIVGPLPNDEVGQNVIALSNGNYVIASPHWNQGAGAVTWRDGTLATSGVVSTTNSLVGSAADGVGTEAFALSDGNYVFTSPYWNGGVAAITWADGAQATIGSVNAGNSFAGTLSGLLSNNPHTVLSSGGYVVQSPGFARSGGFANGAVTLFAGGRPVTGTVTSANSVIGTADTGGLTMASAYDEHWRQLVVGRPLDAIVTVAWPAWPLVMHTSGAGTVAALPALPAPACAISCTADLRAGSVVTLTATPAISSTFGGWSGDCQGAGACVLRMDAARAVTATFTLRSFVLTTQVSGTGVGAIDGIPANPAAIAWGAPITLTALPAASSTFTGWSGDCQGTGACVLTMTQAYSVSAGFDFKNLDVIAPAPQPGGTVTVVVVTASAAHAQPVAVTLQPANGAARTTNYPYGTKLLFTALPAGGYYFKQWGGLPNATQNPQPITLTAPLTVTAQFAVAPVYLPTIMKPRK